LQHIDLVAEAQRNALRLAADTDVTNHLASSEDEKETKKAKGKEVNSISSGPVTRGLHSARPARSTLGKAFSQKALYFYHFVPLCWKA
jgi:hypothetical protein